MTGITTQDVAVLSSVFDVPIDDADSGEVARRLEDMRGFFQELAAFDLADQAPDSSFDPSWPKR